MSRPTKGRQETGRPGAGWVEAEEREKDAEKDFEGRESIGQCTQCPSVEYSSATSHSFVFRLSKGGFEEVAKRASTDTAFSFLPPCS